MLATLCQPAAVNSKLALGVALLQKTQTLFLIIVPIHIIVSQEDIRRGLGPVFGSSVICPVSSQGVSIDVLTPSDYSPCQL